MLYTYCIALYFRLLKTMLSKPNILHQIIIGKFDRVVRPGRGQNLFKLIVCIIILSSSPIISNTSLFVLYSHYERDKEIGSCVAHVWLPHS